MEEDVLQKLADDLAVQLRSGADNIVQIDVPFEYHQHAGLGAAHFAAGNDCLVDGLFQLCDLVFRTEYPHQADILAAQLLQNLADLRLEQDDQRQDAHLRHASQHIVDGAKIQGAGRQQRQQEDADALQDIFRTGALHQRQQLIDQEEYDGHVQKVRDLEKR